TLVLTFDGSSTEYTPTRDDNNTYTFKDIPDGGASILISIPHYIDQTISVGNVLTHSAADAHQVPPDVTMYKRTISLTLLTSPSDDDAIAAAEISLDIPGADDTPFTPSLSGSTFTWTGIPDG